MRRIKSGESQAAVVAASSVNSERAWTNEARWNQMDGSKNRYPKWNPGKWKHGPKPAYPLLFNFEPHPDAEKLEDLWYLKGC